MELSISDLYEASFYLLNGLELTDISCSYLNNKVLCQLHFTGAKATELQYLYFQGKCMVNLFEFRRTYSHLNFQIHEAKKKFRKLNKQGGDV